MRERLMTDGGFTEDQAGQLIARLDSGQLHRLLKLITEGGTAVKAALHHALPWVLRGDWFTAAEVIALNLAPKPEPPKPNLPERAAGPAELPAAKPVEEVKPVAQPVQQQQPQPAKPAQQQQTGKKK